MQEEYKIVFRGSGLQELKDLARMTGVPDNDLGQVVIKALKLLKLSKDKKAYFKEGEEFYSVETKNL